MDATSLVSPPSELMNFGVICEMLFKTIKPVGGREISSLFGTKVVGKLRSMAHNSGIIGNAVYMERASFMVGALFANAGFIVKNTSAFLIIIGAKYDCTFYEDGALDESCANAFKKHSADISQANLLSIMPPDDLPAPGRAFFVYEQLRAYYKMMDLYSPSQSFNIGVLMSMRHLFPQHINDYLDVFTASLDNTPLWGVIHVTIPPVLRYLTEPLRPHFMSNPAELDPLRPRHDLSYDLIIGFMIMHNFAPIGACQQNVLFMAAHVGNTIPTEQLRTALSARSLNVDEFAEYRAHLQLRFAQAKKFYESGRTRLAYEAVRMALKNIVCYANLYMGDRPDQKARREQVYTSLIVHTVVYNYNLIKLLDLPSEPITTADNLIKYWMIPSEYEFTF
jgi:hypothetical protein